MTPLCYLSASEIPFNSYKKSHSKPSGVHDYMTVRDVDYSLNDYLSTPTKTNLICFNGVEREYLSSYKVNSQYVLYIIHATINILPYMCYMFDSF